MSIYIVNGTIHIISNSYQEYYINIAIVYHDRIIQYPAYNTIYNSSNLKQTSTHF